MSFSSRYFSLISVGYPHAIYGRLFGHVTYSSTRMQSTDYFNYKCDDRGGMPEIYSEWCHGYLVQAVSTEYALQRLEKVSFFVL